MLLYLAKGNFADVSKLRILRLGDYTGLSGWIQCKHKGPYKKDVGVREEGDDELCIWRKGHEVRGATKGKEMGFLLRPSRRKHPC